MWSQLAAAGRGEVRGNPACWRGVFSYDVCCSSAHGPKGNPECFDLIYTHEVCCSEAGADGRHPGTTAAMVHDCRASLDMGRLPEPLQCKGTAWVSAESWDEFFHAHQLSQVLGTSFKGWPNVSTLLAQANASTAARRASERDCIFGFVAVLLHSVPAVEKQHGTAAALRAYSYASRLRAGASSLEDMDCRWNEMTNHAMFAHYPLLLGGDARFTKSCPPGMPRIYVYDTGDLADRPFACARTGFWASEVYIDRFLRHSGCRERDWRRADLFFVPVYLTCWELQRASRVSEAAKAAEAEAIAARVRALPHWRRRQGFDHVFLFGASSWVLPGWRELLATSVVLAVESLPIECEKADARCWHCMDCFQPWKDLVVPPVTPLPLTRRLLAHSRPVADRILVMAWHGQHANATEPEVARAYRVTNETVRLSLLGLSHLPNVSVGPPTPNYAAVLGDTQFCLCPKGASSYTSRVFEALFAGCVPVILSDDVRLPFDALVDWSKFSIRWPMEKANMELYKYLTGLLANQPEYVLGLQREVAKVRCWFDYFGFEENSLECSPYFALLQGLAARLKFMPRPAPPFAVPAPGSAEGS